MCDRFTVVARSFVGTDYGDEGYMGQLGVCMYAKRPLLEFLVTGGGWNLPPVTVRAKVFEILRNKLRSV